MDLITAEAKQKNVGLYLMDQLLSRRPQALVEAVQILNSRRDDVVKVMTRPGYTDHALIDGYLDRDLPGYSQ